MVTNNLICDIYSIKYQNKMMYDAIESKCLAESIPLLSFRFKREISTYI